MDTGSEGTQDELGGSTPPPSTNFKAKDMDAKEILSQLILGKITVSQALQLTRLYYSNFISDKSLKWIEDECDGYTNSLNLPDYRLLDCSLVIEVYDGFGNMQEYPLDTSHIVSYLEAGGYGASTPNKMRITQNLESLEHGDRGGVDSDINMYLNDKLRDMILECYRFPPFARFGRLIQKSHAAYVQSLISKVKSKLIEILQTEVLKGYSSVVKEVELPASRKKKIFISYSWDCDTHKLWVHKLVEALREEFDVCIDEKIPLGQDINSFMEQMVSQSDRVLMILTPTYKQKADARENGVGYETVLISEELYRNQSSCKFVPIIRTGTKVLSYPKYLGNRKGLLMVDESEFEINVQSLIEDLKSN